MDDHEDPRPAPGGLELVKEFVNSLDYPSGPDELGDPGAATAWLEHHGIAAGRLSSEDCAQLRLVRERLRDVLEAHTGADVPAAATAELGAALAATPLTVKPTAEGWRLAAPEQGTGALLGTLSSAIVEATVAGT